MNNSIPEKLNQSELAIRLGLKSSGSLTSARYRLSTEQFIKYTRERDPDGIGWKLINPSDGKKRFYWPIKNLNIEADPSYAMGFSNNIVPARICDNNTVLIVEDDQVNARVFSKILTKRGGCCVCHTEDVDKVLNLAESGKISIILMDVSLARSVYQGKAVDGIKITQLLKSNPKTALIPVVLVTAHAKKGDRENFLMQSGADGYISKPIVDHKYFIDEVRKFINLAKGININCPETLINHFLNRQKILLMDSISYYTGMNNELRNNLVKPKKRSKKFKTKVNKSRKNSFNLVNQIH